MSFLNWLFGTKTETPVFHHKGDGYHEHDAVGESFYGNALRGIMAGVEGNEGGWHKLETTARLVPVSNNRHDANAVEVRINGLHVGHLDRASAKTYRKTVGAVPMEVDALIVGKEGNYGVKLDIE